MREKDVPRVVTKKSGRRKLKNERANADRTLLKMASKETLANDDRGTVSEEWLFDLDGRRRRVFTVDANSATFASDLTLMFEKNVARARREHKKQSGSADRARKRA
jgi:hypothetical protein